MKLIGILPGHRNDLRTGSFLRSTPLEAALARHADAQVRVTRLGRWWTGRGRAKRLAKDAIVLVPHLPAWYDEADLDWLERLGRDGARLVLDVADRPLQQNEALGSALPPERRRSIEAKEARLFGLARDMVANAPEWVEGRRPLAIVRNAADPERFARCSPVSPTHRVLYAGSIEPGRGVDDFIEAVGLARRRVSDATLRIVSWRPAPAAVERVRDAARRANVPLDLCLSLPTRHLWRAFDDAQVAVLPAPDGPYWHATDPLKLYDYMASGRPIVCPPARTPASVVRQEQVGVVAEDFGARALADALVPVLEQGELADAMGDRARTAARERHTWRHRGDALAAALGHARP